MIVCLDGQLTYRGLLNTAFGVAVWCSALIGPAQAQHLELWVWTDAQGRTVYSDREPPPSITPQQILQQPLARHGASGSRTARSPHDSIDTTLSPREAVRRANCLAAQASLDQLRGRTNWLVEDRDGRLRPMDDGTRRAEGARLRQIMRDNCSYGG